MNKSYLRFVSDLSGVAPYQVEAFFKGEKQRASTVQAINEGIKKAAEIALDGQKQSTDKYSNSFDGALKL